MSQWNDAERHAERAQRFYRAGQWERALEELREALGHRPDEGEWVFGLGLTLDALQRYDEAAAAYKKALALRGEDVPGLLHLGVDLIRAGQPEAAVETLERLNALEPAATLGYVHRIAAYALLNDHDNAELMFYLARQRSPGELSHADNNDPTNDAVPHLPPARTRRGDGDDEPPSALDVDVLAARQAQSMAFDYLAQSLHARREMDRAVWCWQEALRLAPAHPEANGHLAEVFHHRGQSERARLHYQRQLRLTPDDVDTLLDFADLLFENDRMAEAGEKYRRALDCDPALAIAHQRLGDLALINGHPAAAADRYEQACQLDPSLPGVHLGLASAAHQRGEDEHARQWLVEELECEGQTAAQAIDLASLMLELGMNREVERLLNPLLSGADDLLLNHDDLYATALLCRGVARIAEGDLADGMADGQRCLKLDPTNVTALLQLAQIHFRLGELAAATCRVRQGLGHDPDHPGLRRLRRKIRVAKIKTIFHRLLRSG